MIDKVFSIIDIGIDSDDDDALLTGFPEHIDQAAGIDRIERSAHRYLLLSSSDLFDLSLYGKLWIHRDHHIAARFHLIAQFFVDHFINGLFMVI